MVENQKFHLRKFGSFFCGSESLYRHSIGGKSLLYTEGVLYLTESCESYWLLDIILSYQDSQILKDEDFQIWNLN